MSCVSCAKKIIKYDSNYPEAFANIHQGRAYFESFFKWYNTEHRHTGIALLTPEDVHFNRVDEKQAKRAAVLEAAWIESRNDSSKASRDHPSYNPSYLSTRPKIKPRDRWSQTYLHIPECDRDFALLGAAAAGVGAGTMARGAGLPPPLHAARAATTARPIVGLR